MTLFNDYKPLQGSWGRRKLPQKPAEPVPLAPPTPVIRQGRRTDIDRIARAERAFLKAQRDEVARLGGPSAPPAPEPVLIPPELPASFARRREVEEEFGLPFERAAELRTRYYQSGYQAARQRAETTLRHLRDRCTCGAHEESA